MITNDEINEQKLWYSGEFVLVTQRCCTSFKDVLMAKKRNGIGAMIATHGENCNQIKMRQDRKYIERFRPVNSFL